MKTKSSEEIALPTNDSERQPKGWWLIVIFIGVEAAVLVKYTNAEVDRLQEIDTLASFLIRVLIFLGLASFVMYALSYYIRVDRDRGLIKPRWLYILILLSSYIPAAYLLETFNL